MVAYFCFEVRELQEAVEYSRKMNQDSWVRQFNLNDDFIRFIGEQQEMNINAARRIENFEIFKSNQESFNSNLEEILFTKESDGRSLIQ